MQCVGWFVVFIQVTSVVAQNIVAPNKQWNIVDYNVFTPNISTDIYSFRKDTIINSVNYWQLFRNYDETLMTDWLATDVFMREEDNGSVYILDGSEEKLIYDFSINEGDTIQLEYDFTNCSLVVYAVDSLTLLNGERRKRIRLVSESEPDYSEPTFYGYKDWVEGIGSMTSLTQYLASCYTDYPFDLLCYFENGNLLYSNPDNPDCFITPIENILSNSDEIRVYPNPSGGVFNVELGIGSYAVQVLNIIGEVLFYTRDNKVDLSDYEAGIYFLVFQDEGRRWVKKIIKK